MMTFLSKYRRVTLKLIYKELRKMASAIEDLNAATSRIAADVKAVADRVAALTPATPDDSAEIEASVAALNAAADALEQVAAPAPAPVDTPPAA